MQTRGRTGWRADSGARLWARIMMLGSRSHLTGETCLARVLALPCSLQRGAVVRRPMHARRIDNTLQFYH